MIEIASAAMPQLGSLLPRVIRPRRWRSPKHPPAAFPRARPQPKISSRGRQRTPLGYALSFEIVFDGHRHRSPTDAGDS